MGFLAASLNLGIPPEGEDVVADDVFPPVVLVEASMGRTIDDVPFGNNVCAPLVKVDPPASVTEACNVMKKVETYNRPRLNTQRVDATHVAQDRSIPVRQEANVVDAVILYNILLG